MEQEPIKPYRVAPGATLGIVSPGGVVDSKVLDGSIEILRAAGYRVKLAEGVLAKKRYLAGFDRDRARDIMRMVTDGEVDAVIAARGGYGSIQILPFLDQDLIRRNRKPFVGYSDVTILLNWIVQTCGLVAFHGPMALDFARPEKERSAMALLSFLAGMETTPPIELLEIRSGDGRGRLVGGCLSVLVTTLGTPHEMSTDGRVLFLEDVGEKPYRLERALDQLKSSGKLDRLRGVVFGELNGWSQNESELEQVRDILEDVFSQFPYPVYAELLAGHGARNLTVPLGVNVVLSNAKLVIEESPFCNP